MLTQREKLYGVIARLESHDYFENPYKVTREEARIILKSLRKHLSDLEYGHDNYMSNRERKIEEAKARYKNNKAEIIQQKRRRAIKQAIEAVKGVNDDEF